MAAKAPPTPAERATLVVRGLLVVAYLLVILFVQFTDVGRRVVWTMAIASLPLFWVLGGYHLWRRICPLAFFSQVGRILGRPGDRKVEGWWADNALLVQLGLMIAALSLRLLWINGSQLGLAGFLAGVALIALASGFIFRGRSWCHYACPVGLVEKLYTEPPRLRPAGNSQCPRCSACTSLCPDIDAERAYWKGNTDRARRIAYFAWPGIVFGFYAHYWVQAGTWDWYYDGAWTREGDIASKVLEAGWFFGPLPRLAAAPLTLLVCGAVSYGLFALGHRVATRRATERAGGSLPADAVERLRHRAFALAGYLGFNVFYAFAGQPTLRTLPGWVQWGVAVTVVAASTMLFIRRWNRSEASFLQEKLATKLARRWRWDDDASDRSSTELVVLHTERTRQRKEALDGYKQSVQELAAEGILRSDGLAALKAVRATLGITEAEHKKVMKGLDLSGASPESALQREQYRAELERLVELAAESGAPMDARHVERLQRRFGVSPDEHDAMLAVLLDPSGNLRSQLAERALRLLALGAMHRALDATSATSLEKAFIDAVLVDAGTATSDALRAALGSLGELPPEAAGIDAPSVQDRAEAARALMAGPLDTPLPTPSPDPLADALEDADPWVARAASLVRGDAPVPGTDRLVALRSVTLFAGLSPVDLAALDARAELRSYPVDGALCVQGDAGDEVLIILSGTVRIDVSGAVVNTCGPGSCIGELAALAPAPRSASVLADAPTEALVLSGDSFRDLLREQPLLAEGVLEQVARRLQRATR